VIGRRIATLTVASGCLLLLTACTPATRGLVGLTLDADGHPIAVFAPCEGQLAGIRFEDDPVRDDGDPGDQISRWKLDPADDITEFDVFAESGVDPSDPRTLVINAWAQHGGWPSGETKNLWWIEFEAADLEGLETGSVMFMDISGDFELVTESRSAFESTACPDES
jgi:hypothetical protein